MCNCPVAQNWRQNTLRYCRFASNWPVFLGSQNLSKTLCKTFLLLEIAPNHTAQLSFCLEGKAWGKHCAQLSFCSTLATNHNAQLSFCLKWATFLIKLKLVQNTVRNRAVARNWPQVRLRNCPFAWNWPVLLGSQNLWKTLCKTFLLIEIGPKSQCATVVVLEMGDISYKAKTCPKHRAQPCCCSKLAPSQTAQLSFCLKLARIVRKLKPVRNCMRNWPVNQNWCLLLKS